MDITPSRRADVLLAAALTAAGLLQVILWPIAARGLGELFVLGSTLPLAWRRTHPVEAAAISSAFWLIPLDGFPILGFITVILQFYALGAHGRPRLAVALTSLWAAAAGVAGTLLGPEPAVAAVGSILVVVAPVVAGQVVAQYRQQNAALAELTRELVAERARAEEAAVGSERARIAQELHDVVGHELTLIAIQAEAAAAALRLAPDRASAPVETIRATAHRTLAEIRSTLDTLAPDPGTQGLDGLAEIAQRAEAAGIRNNLSVSGTPWPGHGSAVLAINRIVRECLTNAGRHAPGQPVTLRVDWRAEAAEVHAANPVPAGTSSPVAGRGLTGIRHRAELLGGTFAAGTRDGCFEVRVVLPAPAVTIVP